MNHELMHIGRFLIILGIVIVVIGGLLMLSGKVSWLGQYFGQYFGRLPGDIIIQRKNFTFYFPLVTSILISLLLTFIFWIIGRR
jgi:hypothetical protein